MVRTHYVHLLWQYSAPINYMRLCGIIIIVDVYIPKWCILYAAILQYLYINHIVLDETYYFSAEYNIINHAGRSIITK